MRTSHALHPTVCFDHLLLGSSELKKPLEVGNTWMPEVALGFDQRRFTASLTQRPLGASNEIPSLDRPHFTG